jgi:hypothetical protein
MARLHAVLTLGPKSCEDEDRDQTKHPAIAGVGRCSAQLPRATDREVNADAATAPGTPWAGRPPQRCRPTRDASPPLVRSARTATDRAAVGAASCSCPHRTCPCRACPCRGCRACRGRLPDACPPWHPACRVGLPTRPAGCRRTGWHRVDPRNPRPGMPGAGCPVNWPPAPPHLQVPPLPWCWSRHQRSPRYPATHRAPRAPSACCVRRLGRAATTAVRAAWRTRFDTGADSVVPRNRVSRAISSACPCIRNTS